MSGTRPVLVIGSLNMDLVVRCDALPLRGQTIFGHGFFTAAGGKGANQAVAAARLGAAVRMAGCVGLDGFGQQLLAGLRQDGIATDAVRQVAQPTGVALITVDAAGGNTIVVASGANLACDAALTEQALAAAGAPGVLLLQHEIPAAANAQAIRAAREAGWFIVLNPAPARELDLSLLPLIDLIVPNETEAAAIVGTDEPREAARRLLVRGARAALVTLGGQGALYRDAGEEWHCPALAVEAIDTTAAGDGYIGALAAGLASGQQAIECLSFAAAAAALSVTRLGAQPSLGTHAAVTEFIALHGLPQPVRLVGEDAWRRA